MAEPHHTGHHTRHNGENHAKAEIVIAIAAAAILLYIWLHRRAAPGSNDAVFLPAQGAGGTASPLPQVAGVPATGLTAPPANKTPVNAATGPGCCCGGGGAAEYFGSVNDLIDYLNTQTTALQQAGAALAPGGYT